MIDLEEIEARANNATEGPWETACEVEGSDWGDHEVWGIAGVSEPEEVLDHFPAHIHLPGMSQQDAEFIAAARQDVPALVARIRELEATVKRVREAFHPELGKLCFDCLIEVETILDGTP